MKLRNKKTGEVKFVEFIKMYGVCPVNFGNYKFNSLAELNEEWEDYEPKEPLIKDEKIRKAVRAWAEAINTKEVLYSEIRAGFYSKQRNSSIDSSIDFPCEVSGVKEGTYSITELCGEEEE